MLLDHRKKLLLQIPQYLFGQIGLEKPEQKTLGQLGRVYMVVVGIDGN